MRVKRRREKQIEGRVCDRALKEHGVPNVPLKLLLGTDTGWPDRLFFVGCGATLLVEFKDPDEGEISPKQEYTHGWLRGLGYDVQVHDNEEQALAAIESAKLEAARLSEEGNEVPARPRRRNRAAGPRPR